MIPLKAILFVSLSLEIRAQLKGKIKVEAEKNSKTQSFFFIIFSGVASRAWWEKSRLEFFPFHYEHWKKSRHSSGSAIVSCFERFDVNSRIFSGLVSAVKAVKRVLVKLLKFIFGASASPSPWCATLIRIFPTRGKEEWEKLRNENWPKQSKNSSSRAAVAGNWSA